MDWRFSLFLFYRIVNASNFFYSLLGIETDYIEDVKAEVFDQEDLTYRNKGLSNIHLLNKKLTLSKYKHVHAYI